MKYIAFGLNVIKVSFSKAVYFASRSLKKRKALMVSAFLIFLQLATPLTSAIVYAAATASNDVGSSAALDPVGNKATRLQTQGSQGVDQSTGALTYSYPLTILAGRNGMAPSLALSYNSQNNDTGWFGYGWVMSVPYIERTTKFGTDKLYATSTSFVSSLHGELISTNGLNYEQKIDDGSYANYTLTGSSWQMTDRDGTTYYFGNSYVSRVQNDAGTKIGRWYLTEVRDKFGNGIVYDYVKDSGTVYPSTISYTEHALAHPLNLVTFNLESKNDNLTSYKYGFKTIDTKRVSYIKVSTNGRDNAYFSFTYGTGANGVRSLLQGVEEKHLSTNDDWTVLPKTTFEYENSSSTFSGTISNTQNPYGTGASLNTVIDTNNDGILDLYNAGDGFFPVDINGDYKKDLMQSDVFYLYAFSDGRNIIFKYNQGGSFYTRTFKLPGSTGRYSLSSGEIIPPVRYKMDPYILTPQQESAIADVNGDGFDDVIYNDPLGQYGVAINTTNNTFDYSTSSSLTFSISNSQVADVNGDGLQDLIVKWYTSTSTLFGVFLNDGIKYQPIADFVYDAKVASTTPDSGVRFVDINNDGLVDIIRSYTSSYSKFSGPSCSLPYTYIPSDSGPAAQTVNDALFNTGSSFVAASTTLSGYVLSYSSCNVGGAQGYIVTNATKEYDVNGDLTTDYDGATNNTKKQDVLKKVNTSLGSTLDVSYRWTTQSGLNPTLPVPMYIVATTTEKLSVSDANPHSVGYNFYNGQMYFDATSPRDHKFAGFGKVEVIDGKNKTTTYYHQGNGDDYTTGEKGDSYYNIGRAYRTDTFDLSSGSSTLVNKNLSLYTTYSYASSSFTYLDSQIVNAYNSDGSFVSSGSKSLYDETKRLIKTSYKYGDIEPFVSFASSTITDRETDLITTQYQYSNTRPQRLVKEVSTDYAGISIGTTNYYYDGLPFGLVDKGALTSTTNTVYNPNGTINSTSTTQISYDPTGNAIQSIDGLNNKTKVTYDSSYTFPITKVDALNGTTTLTYDPYTLNLLTSKGPDGITSVKETDGLGKVTRSYLINTAGGITDEVRTNYVYGNGITVYGRRLGNLGTSARTLEVYDSYGRLIQSKKETQPDTFSTQDTKYDANSNVISTSLPYTTTGYGFTTDTPSNGSSIYTYDGLGRVISKSVFGTTLTYQYGARNLTVYDNASTQHKKFYAYDANSNLSQVREYNATSTYTTNYNYTPQNKLTSITDANGNTRNFAYLSNGLLIYQEDPHPTTDTTFTTYSYTYNVLGNLLSKVGSLGTTTYAYDALSRPTTRTLLDSVSGTSTVTFAYNGCSNNYLAPCTVARDTTSSTTFTYDTSGKVSNETMVIGSKSFARSYTYDIYGNPETITYPDSGKVTYTYTLDGKQSTLTYLSPNGTTKNIVTGSTYNSLNSLASLTYGNGVQFCNTYTSTSADGVISPKLAKSVYLFNSTGCSPVVNQVELYKDEFTYKDALTPSSILSTYKDIVGTTHTKSDTLTYDNLVRLTQVSTSYDGGSAVVDTLVYDPIGNILKENDVLYRYSQDGTQNAHAATSIGGYHITYDGQGNKTQAGDNVYTWNALNQMLTASSSNGLETYTYDENGERIKKVVTATTVVSQRATPATSSSTSPAFTQGDLLTPFATSSTYIATSTYNTLSSLALLDKGTLTTLVDKYYGSPFISKFCATEITSLDRQICTASTTRQLIGNDINNRSTSTIATYGLVVDLIKIVTGEYLIPTTYVGLATSSIAVSLTGNLKVKTATITSFNTFVATGIVVPMSEYEDLPYVSSSTYSSLTQVGLTDTSKVRALLVLTGCTSLTTSCATAKKVVFEKFYKENGYLLADKALEEIWYVFAVKARLPSNSGEFTSTSTILGNITVPNITGIGTSTATSTYYSGLYFTTEYTNQNLSEPRLTYFNILPYYVTQSAFTELQQAGITQVTLENYQSLITDLFSVKLASSTEYMVALKDFALYDKKVTLSQNALKELYLVSLGAASIPNNLTDYISNATFDLTGYLSTNSYQYNPTLGTWFLYGSSVCNAGAFEYYGSIAVTRCIVTNSSFTLPVATSSTVSYILSTTIPPQPVENPLIVGKSSRGTVELRLTSSSSLAYLYDNQYSTTIANDGSKLEVDITPVVVARLAGSTTTALIVNPSEYGPYAYSWQATSVTLKAYVATPKLTLASTTLVSGVTNATSSIFTPAIDSAISAYFGEIYDSSSLVTVSTSTATVISPEAYGEFASTTLRDVYDISQVFLATSTPWCEANASTTECDKQARISFFRNVISNLTGFVPSQAGVEEFWMVHKGILTLPNINYASTTGTTTIPGFFAASTTLNAYPNAYVYSVDPGHYDYQYVATTTASTTVTILNTQAGGTTFTAATGSQYILSFCGSYCNTPTFNGVSMTNLVTRASPNTNSDIRVFGLATTTSQSVPVTSNCGTNCGNATDHYRWVSLSGVSTSSYYYDTQSAAGNNASSLSVTENLQDKNNLTIISSNISTVGTSGGTGSSPLVATTSSRLWYHYATTTGNFTYSITGLGSTDAEIASIQINHNPNDTVTPGYYTANYIATTTLYYIATTSQQLPGIFTTVLATYPVFSRSSLPTSLSTSTVTNISTSTVPGHWATEWDSLDYIATSTATSTGGTITNLGSVYFHTFTATGTFSTSNYFPAKVLVLGGGGASNGGPGGGGGQYVYNGAFAMASSSYSVIVGAAGATSSFDTLIAPKGGDGVGGTFTGGSSMTYTGGTGGSNGMGGGAGAAANGSNGSGNFGGGGGNGFINPIPGSTHGQYSGGNYYLGGGGGGYGNTGHASGGLGGGGLGNYGGAATANFGGGGGSYSSGSSGVVIVSYDSVVTPGFWLTVHHSSTTPVYIATTTLTQVVTNLSLVPAGLLSDLQYNATYSTSTFAQATSTKAVSEDTYNELLRTPIRLNSDVDTIFDYALPFATSTCPGQAATSSCVVTAQKSKVKDVVSQFSGFVLSDAAAEELYRVKTGELSIIPISLSTATLSTSSQSVTVPLDPSVTYTTFTQGTSTPTKGDCSFGTQGGVTDSCYIELPYINSPISSLQMTYQALPKTLGTSTMATTLVSSYATTTAGTSTPTIITSTTTGLLNGTKVGTSTFFFDLGSLYQLYISTLSPTLQLYPDGVGTSSKIYSLGTTTLNLTRSILIPRITYTPATMPTSAFSRTSIPSLATTTATTTVDMTSTPALTFSATFLSPVGPIASGTTIYAGYIVDTTPINLPVPPQQSLPPVSYPFATSTATTTVNTLTVSTTTSYTVYSPFTNYTDDTARDIRTTYFTLNGVLVGAYTYKKNNESTTGKVTYIHSNYLGTPVIETDEKGDIVEMDITDVFGNYVQRDQRNDNAYHNKGYTSHEYDDVTGLTYAHARYLDTKTHSFLSVDPLNYSLPQSYLLDPQQMNSYAYARNNPIVYTDPTGQYTQNYGPVGDLPKSPTYPQNYGYSGFKGPQISSYTGMNLRSQTTITFRKSDVDDLVLSGYGQAAKDDWLAGNYGYAIGLGFLGGTAAISSVVSSPERVGVNITAKVLRGANNPITRSTAAYGRDAHKFYKIGIANGETLVKEFNKIPGIRPDFVDLENKIIYELKPDNLRAIKQGEKQLNTYIKAFKDAGYGDFKGVLQTYQRE